MSSSTHVAILDDLTGRNVDTYPTTGSPSLAVSLVPADLDAAGRCGADLRLHLLAPAWRALIAAVVPALDALEALEAGQDAADTPGEVLEDHRARYAEVLGALMAAVGAAVDLCDDALAVDGRPFGTNLPEMLSEALSRVAHDRGGPDALLRHRPGSWEAATLEPLIFDESPWGGVATS